MTKFLRFFIAMNALLLSGVAHAGTLSLTIQGITESKGNLMVALYDSEANYKENENAYAAKRIPAQSGAVSVVFEDVAPGTYAIKLFHDVNGDGKINFNFVGFPKEPFAFSNNVMGSFGPPKFKKAAFEVGRTEKSITIDLMS